MMVMMPVMMVVMVSVTALVGGRVAGQLVTMLIGRFEFKRCVRDSVLCEFLANGFFNLVCVSLSDNVERCIVVISVHTPYVDVVNIFYALDMCKVLANFIDFDAVRRFFEEEIDGFLQIFERIDENEGRNADGH